MRQLAAILFADIEGYTALMQENEQLARVKRKRLKEVLESSINQFNGRILQYYGDGSLSVFGSAIDSVRSAIQIQHQLRQDPKVDLRIGIHTGDVTIEDEAIYGDGVNVASRIESLAVGGGIFISDKVYDEVKNQDGITAQEMGYFELKNIKQPMHVYAISNPGIVVPSRDEVKGKVKQPGNRLAVLPFVNMSADPENEYFSDGITEELLNALTRIDGLQVTSRTSAFAFKGKNDDVREIAAQLNVDKVLEGSVRKAGNRVRITAQLINGADGYHIWSESYDRNMTDIFEVQDEISGIIANKLKEDLVSLKKKEKKEKTRSKNITAYTYFLKGRHFWNKLTPADCRKAIEYFELAIAIEPNYAQAYAMRAAAYSYLGSSGQMLPDRAFEIVQKDAEKALELDPRSAEGHIARASSYLFYEWKWKEAYDELQQAIQLNPSAVEAYELLGFFHIIMGEKLKAVKVLEDAEQLDPMSPAIILSLGSMYMFADRYDDAIVQANKLLDVYPRMRVAIELKAWATGNKGDWPGALELFKEVHRLTGHPLKGLLGMGVVYGILGEREKVLDIIALVEQRQVEEPDSVLDGDLAGLWFGLGDHDKTFYYLNRCIDKRMGPVNYFLEYPIFRELKKDPRYEELKRRIGVETIMV